MQWAECRDGWENFVVSYETRCKKVQGKHWLPILYFRKQHCHFFKVICYCRNGYLRSKLWCFNLYSNYSSCCHLSGLNSLSISVPRYIYYCKYMCIHVVVHMEVTGQLNTVGFCCPLLHWNQVIGFMLLVCTLASWVILLSPEFIILKWIKYNFLLWYMFYRYKPQNYSFWHPVIL